METIINYLENMFATLPKTNQMRKIKDEILANMEEKYHELKRDGKTENEAIGIVISEFGNIDELIEEFELDQESEGILLLPEVTEEEVNEYLEANKKNGKMIGIGVVLCIIGAASLILVTQLIEDGLFLVTGELADIIGLIPLFILVAVAVSIFIISGMKMEKYKYVEQEVEVPLQVKASLKTKLESFQQTYIMSVVIGVLLCILSPIVLIILSTFGSSFSVYGVVILLAMVAMAVYTFIYFGTIKDGYKKLLKIEEYSKRKKEENRIIGAVAAIIWPLAVVVFLITGLIYNLWHINWIVFPITGLLFAMFSGAYIILKGEGNR